MKPRAPSTVVDAAYAEAKAAGDGADLQAIADKHGVSRIALYKRFEADGKAVGRDRTLDATTPVDQVDDRAVDRVVDHPGRCGEAVENSVVGRVKLEEGTWTSWN